MRQHPPRRWTNRLTSIPLTDALRARGASPLATIPTHLRQETPGEDGIRHGLVAHVRELIAAGLYDTPRRWAMAEAAILDRYCE